MITDDKKSILERVNFFVLFSFDLTHYITLPDSQRVLTRAWIFKSLGSFSVREVLVNFDKYSWGNICELLAEYLSFVWKIFVAESDLRSACKSGSLVTGYLQMIVDSTMPTIRRRTPSCQREEMPSLPKHNWQSAHERLWGWLNLGKCIFKTTYAVIFIWSNMWRVERTWKAEKTKRVQKVLDSRFHGTWFGLFGPMDPDGPWIYLWMHNKSVASSCIQVYTEQMHDGFSIRSWCQHSLKV